MTSLGITSSGVDPSPKNIARADEDHVVSALLVLAVESMPLGAAP